MPVLTRRTLLSGLAASVASPAILPASTTGGPQLMDLQGDVPPGQIHVMPDEFSLYWTLPDRKVLRYFIGVAEPERWVGGTFRIRRKAEWPSWTPTPAMIRRDPETYEQ